MLTLRELRFKGIGRFVEEQSISFDDLGNLIQVDGFNKNTGGSSGAGKSTIFAALDFLFGVNTSPNGLLQSRLTDETMTVEADFDFDGKPLTISRGKKLKIVLDGEVTTGSSKLTEEKLDQILAIPRHLFRPMLHKVQGERGFFLNFTPKETNDFLTDCLGLSRFRKYLEELQKRELDLSNLISSQSNSFEVVKAKRDAVSQTLTALGPEPKATMDRESIVKVKTKSDYSNQILNELQNTQRAEMEALEKTRPSIIHMPFDNSVLKLLEAEIQVTSKELEIAEEQERKRLLDVGAKIYATKTRLSEIKAVMDASTEARNQALLVASQIKKIRENVCPTCEQGWATEAAKQKEQELLKKIGELKIVISKSLGAEEDLESTLAQQALLNLEDVRRPVGDSFREKRRELNALVEIERTKQGKHYALESATNKANQDSFLREQRSLASKHETALGQARGQADLDRRILDNAVSEMRAHEIARVQYETSSRTLREQEKELEAQIVDLTTKLEESKNRAILLEELKKVIKSYLSCRYDEALEYISESATRMVRYVPNMANATIQLKGIRETKEGKIKEEVNALLHLDGDENIDIRSLCGGERSAIDLAVDLSVIELIENKTNKGINIFILDEPFTGLDTVCIEMALELLKNTNLNKKLIIVDHNPEVKQMVESKLLVTREGLTSIVVKQ